MTKRFLTFLVGLTLTLPVFASTHKMFDEFQNDINGIKKELSGKKITLQQASVLLSGIQARQNQVLIYQNEKLIELLQNMENNHKKSEK